MRAACRGVPVDWFYASGRGATRPARAICQGCPVRLDCLADALEVEARLPYRSGVRGGLTAGERAALWARSGPGLPPGRLEPGGR